MKLPYPSLTLAEKLEEFDIWITPSTGEIKDTDRFKEELERVVVVFDVLAKATHDFDDISHCDPVAIANTVTNSLAGKSNDDSIIFLEAFAAVLFLVTGKSDNNGKCQLPLHIRDSAGWTQFPTVRRGKLGFKEVPRELKADKYMKIVHELNGHKVEQVKLLNEFCRFVLSDEEYVAQLWSIGKSFVLMKQLGREKALLTPLVVFQVRGSVSASGGHGPEEILRERLLEWGLERGVDFNTTDVIPPSIANAGRAKTRAYDFVLPYQTPTWEQQIFIQCQFYAGDSGSVSHKNVDQTSASRAYVSPIIPHAKFVEYLDGAGYFSSLNGDLKSLLSMTTTTSFFQIRSANVRLRRELQQIGFLTPLEVEHAILMNGTNLAGVSSALINDGYKPAEVDRCIIAAKSRGILRGNSTTVEIAEERHAIARRMLILDTICCFGSRPNGGSLAGSVFAPGNGSFCGMKLDELVAKVIEIAPAIQNQWNTPTSSLEDLRWLSESGFTVSR